MNRVMAVAGGIALLAATVAGPAHAAIIFGCADDAPGDCTGTLTFNSGTGVLTVSLTNTSPVANGGFLTAIAFQNPDEADITGVTGGTQPTGFTFIGDATGDTISVSPFGDADWGSSATGGDWLGGGTPDGLEPGETGVFNFTLSGSGLASVTEADLLAGLLIRFRGFNDGTSDKDIVTGEDGPTDEGSDVIIETPEPASVTLLATGLLLVMGSAVVRRLRRK